MPQGNNDIQNLSMKRSELNSSIQTDIGSSKVQLRIAQDPDETSAKRAAAKAKYDTLVKKIATNKKTVAGFTKEIDKYYGQQDLTTVEKDYTELKSALDLQVDPNSEEAKSLKKQIEELLPKYQAAYSKVKGVQVSSVVARSKMTKTALPTLGGSSGPMGATGPTGPSGASGASGATGNKTSGSSGPSGASGPSATSSTGTSGITSDLGVGGDQGGSGTKTVPSVVKATPLETLLAKTEFWYDLPDYIFKLEPKLGELLVRAVDEGWDPNTVEGNAKFLNAAKLTPWWQKNSGAIRTRIVDRAKYDELKAAGEDVTKTDYGLYLKKQMGSVKAKAKELAGVTLTDEQAQGVAQKIYDGFLDDDPLAINALIVPYIGKISSIVGNGIGGKGITGFSGQALKDYQVLQGIAKSNGFTIKDILPGISAITTGGDLETAVLQKLALGEIDINRIAQDARTLAAQGQPEYVRGLLNQGYDLENIYAPYRQQMATVLEVDPNTIDLNDPSLRAAITEKGDMNLYDFKKGLRKDSRWQYTEGANAEVADATKQVLQDFGFMG